jgi:predicted nucleic acid-binding protein
MPPSVYLETTIVSYLAARRSRDVIQAAHQRITHEWWARRSPAFELHTSQLVIDEARRGSPTAAAKRLALLRDLRVLDVTDEAHRLADRLLGIGAVPRVAHADALHVAIAAAHGIDYVLTWNCRHIANARAWMAMSAACATLGLESPVLCTPEELMQE